MAEVPTYTAAEIIALAKGTANWYEYAKSGFQHVKNGQDDISTLQSAAFSGATPGWNAAIDTRWYVADTSSSTTTYTGATSPTATGSDSLFAGYRIFFNPANSNTGASTLNVSSSDAAVGIKKISGGAKVALVAGDLDDNSIHELVFDGTHWILLNPLVDALYQYGTIYVDAGAMSTTETAGAETGTNEYATNDVNWDYFAFDTGATEEQVQFKIVMPENWDRSTIKAKFYWSSASGSTAGDTVEWAIKATALANDDAIDASWGTEQVITDTVLAGTNGDLHLTSATPAITIAGSPALGEMVTFEVNRNTAGTDDMAEDAWLFGVLIQIKMTSTVAAW